MQEILKKIDELYNIYGNGEHYEGYKRALDQAKEIILGEQNEPCVYILEDEDGNTWECSKCGELWQLISGAPKDNNMNYCPSCGRPLNQPYTDTDEVFNRR